MLLQGTSNVTARDDSCYCKGQVMLLQGTSNVTARDE